MAGANFGRGKRAAASSRVGAKVDAIRRGADLIELATESPARFDVGDKALDYERELVEIVGPFGIYDVEAHGRRPGYIVKYPSGDRAFWPACCLWGVGGAVRHVYLACG